MRLAVAFALGIHAAIHLLGFLKAFGIVPLPPIALPISRPMGAVWLAAAVFLFAADLALLAAPRWFWLAGSLGILASQAAISTSWDDAKVGTVANVFLLAVVVFGAFAWGPFGLRAEFDRLVLELSTGGDQAPITEADLAALPGPVQRYLRVSGAVGKPRPSAVHVRLTGRIRGEADDPWMPFVAEQYTTFDPPRRYFWMDATRSRLPVDVFHAYDAAGATMRVRLLSLVPMVDLSGPALTRAETVTLLNEMALYAPSTLLDSKISWRAIDDQSVEASYTHGSHSVRAVLVFGDEGFLFDFWSDDRPSLAPDGVTLLERRWSTPVRDPRDQGPFRLASRGEGRYSTPAVDYAYLEIDSIKVDVKLPDGKRSPLR